PRARGPEALARVVQVPQVQIADLRAFDRDYAHHRARLDRPRIAAADRHDVLVHPPPLVGRRRYACVEAAVEVEPARRGGIAVQAHRASLSSRPWAATAVRV